MGNLEGGTLEIGDYLDARSAESHPLDATFENVQVLETALSASEVAAVFGADAAPSVLRGADVDTLTSWDRVSCRPQDVLLATSWHRGYTPQECARLCSKVKAFGGKWCTHFSRQWAHSDVEEHSDMCGRDGDPMMAHHPVMELSTSWRGPRAGPRSVARAETGTWTAAGGGAGEYSYPAQCIFYYSENDDCCATKKGWTTANPHVAGASSTHCTDRFGARSDHWNTKHRTWKVAHAPAPWPPAANPAWPTKGIVPRTLSYTVTWSKVFASNASSTCCICSSGACCARRHRHH